LHHNKCVIKNRFKYKVSLEITLKYIYIFSRVFWKLWWNYI